MKQQTPKQNRPPMPIEKLLAEKNEVETMCSIQKKKLYDDFEYIRNNTSHLLLSGLSSLLFSSGGRTKRKPGTESVAPANDSQSVVPVNDKSVQNGSLFSASNLLAVANTMAPVVWNIVRPMLIKWGVNKAKSLLIGLFTKKEVAATAKNAK